MAAFITDHSLSPLMEVEPSDAAAWTLGSLCTRPLNADVDAGNRELFTIDCISNK